MLLQIRLISFFKWFHFEFKSEINEENVKESFSLELGESILEHKEVDYKKAPWRHVNCPVIGLHGGGGWCAELTLVRMFWLSRLPRLRIQNRKLVFSPRRLNKKERIISSAQGHVPKEFKGWNGAKWGELPKTRNFKIWKSRARRSRQSKTVKAAR